MKNKNQFSRIISGTMTWGPWGKQLSTREMASLIQQCFEMGITTFDHADIYGGYTMEAAFGKAFAESSIEREQLQFITKCGIQYVCEARENKVKHYNYGKDYIIWSAERSLRELQTEYLDLFLLHRPSPLMHPEEVAAALGELMQSGKVRSFGVSNFTPSQIALIEKEIPVSGNQVEFSLTAHSVMFDGTLDDMLLNDRMLMSWSPLGSYFREKNEQRKRIKKALKPLRKKYNASPSQLLLAWILKHPARAYPVVGTTNPERLNESMEAVELEMELEDWFALLTASQGHKVP
ncbi:aldo/keto reductase [Lentiprolixibacter aurantiacus]|uniref:Aldo/keto reductase n=1 Tax=Lentiprolixibacter aurantiacus TaxID=2993939 RepID=A0AAE3SME6_9FLAO|nr:aldo/keto reductase [Lentiprolixibacter aurantiacus]MCX2718365.1 aldo/keto reductase [Lentiprolixibacter aurantiacus]